MNFSESLNVALWCGKEEAPGDRVGILRPDSGRRAGVVMFSTDETYFTLGVREGRGRRRSEESRGGAGSQVPHVFVAASASARAA